MKPLGKEFWNQRYEENQIPWDAGKPTPPITEYIDQISDRDISILIPGCGNAYEAEYLISNGFTDVTLVDISDKAIENAQGRFKEKKLPLPKLITGNFFELKETYDLILEQTFFCALDPQLRQAYVDKMHQLLRKAGRLAGVLFNREFEGGPPFGGSKNEYEKLFEAKFHILKLEDCYNSIKPRQGTELFMEVEKIGV